jgi:hypothetical protein
LVRISTRSYGNWIHVPWWYDDIQGQNYAGKLLICAFDMVCKLEMRYLFGAGLLVPRASYHSIF